LDNQPKETAIASEIRYTTLRKKQTQRRNWEHEEAENLEEEWDISKASERRDYQEVKAIDRGSSCWHALLFIL
jgi:hypothetical protein